MSDELAPGWVFMVIFGVKTIVLAVWGVHAMVVSRHRREPDERWWQSASFWIGAALVSGPAIDAGTFAFYFLRGMAVFTWHGVPMYSPGMIISMIAFGVWLWVGHRTRKVDQPDRCDQHTREDASSAGRNGNEATGYNEYH